MRLHESLRFERPEIVSDGQGGTETGWSNQFTTKGAYKRLRGSEAVQAARLAGRQPTVITIRHFQAARSVTTAWRIVDARSGEVFNIRAAPVETEDRQYLEILAESGVAV